MPAVLTDVADHVLTVTLNRPEKKNAVNAEVMCRLVDAWERLDSDKERKRRVEFIKDNAKQLTRKK